MGRLDKRVWEKGMEQRNEGKNRGQKEPSERERKMGRLLGQRAGPGLDPDLSAPEGVCQVSLSLSNATCPLFLLPHFLNLKKDERNRAKEM